MIPVNNIITALDTPSSLLPFFVKDSFDVTGRTVMAHHESGKHEARERFIEEAGTSAFWIGGIPLVRYIGNKLFKKQLDTDIDFKRINSSGVQGYFPEKFEKEQSKLKFQPADLTGIKFESEKLLNIRKDLIAKGLKPNGSAKGFYKKYNIGITAASVLINLAILTVGLPKFNQYLSRVIIDKETKKQKEQEANANNLQSKAANGVNVSQKQADTKTHFTGAFSAIKDFLNPKEAFNFTKMAEKAQLNVQSSMLILDWGISGSRVTVVPRNNNERVENAVKEGGIIFFFYYAADILKDKLADLADKIFKTPIKLDYKVIASNELLNELKNSDSKNEFLHFPALRDKDEETKGLSSKAAKALKAEIDEANETSIIKFIDAELEKATQKGITNPEDVFENYTLKLAQKDGLIKVEKDGNQWIRHSKKFIQTDKVGDLNGYLNKFAEAAMNATKGEKSTIEDFISKTKKVKIASIIANIAICCSSLSFILPKIQYLIREHRTQTKRAPGIKMYQDLAENNQLKV